MSRMRIGQGFDVHRFTTEQPLKLCGVTCEDGPGLEGHSDADVGLHAVTDAILGAIARGDIGEHFPDTEAGWRDADSKNLVNRAIEMATAEGYALVNCDLTFVGERPSISHYRNRLRRSLAEILGVPLSVVSIKATTTEGLGFVGRSEGLAALAVVLLEKAESSE